MNNTSASNTTTAIAPVGDTRTGDPILPFGIPLSSLLSRARTVVTRSSASGLWRYETVVDAEAAVDAAYGWDRSFDEEKEAALLAELPGPVAEIVTWAGPVHLDVYDAESNASIDELWECCDAESADLALLMGRMRAQLAYGELDSLFQAWGYVSRLLLLDSVSVAPAWRGRGIGVHLAATSLLTAGAFDTCSAVAAVAGSRDKDNYDAVKQRASTLLGSLGLVETCDDLWVGSCALKRPGDTIAQLADVG